MLSALEANRRYFREAYRAGKHGWAVEEPSPQIVRFLEQVRREAPGGRLLDVGCGEGRHAIAAARLAFKVTGVDYEPLAVARARTFARHQGAKGIRFQVADVFRLPFPDAAFDVVVDCGCLHHQRKCDWAAYRSSILRVLRPGGHFILSVFSPEFRFFRGTGRRWHIAFGAYRRCFTRRDLAGLFSNDFETLATAEERGANAGFLNSLMRRRSR